MPENKIKIPFPHMLREQILTDGRYVIRGRGPRGPCLIAYDPLRQTGGVWHEEGYMWSLWTPIDLQDFLASLAGQNYTIAETGDLQTWLDAVNELRNVTAH